MRRTVDFLDAVKARQHLTSDYSVGPKLGLTRAAISSMRNKKSFLGDSTAIKVAELAEIDPAEVVISAHWERAKTPEERALWESILKRLGGSAAALALAFGLAGAPAPADAAQVDQSGIGVMSRRPRRMSKDH